MKGPFLTPSAPKGPFLTLDVTKGPFIPPTVAKDRARTGPQRPERRFQDTPTVLNDAFMSSSDLKASFRTHQPSRTRLSGHEKARARSAGPAKQAKPTEPASGQSPPQNPSRTFTKGEAHHTYGLPALPSTWRSPITPCQGGHAKPAPMPTQWPP